MRVVDTKYAVAGLSAVCWTEYANEATVATPRTAKAPRFHRFAATRPMTSIRIGQTR
jgi:hypothetical protein